MCPPVVVNDLETGLRTLLHSLFIEIDKGRSCMFMEPDFVDLPIGNYLRDIEVNCNHATEHLKAAQDLMFKVVETLNKGGKL